MVGRRQKGGRGSCPPPRTNLIPGISVPPPLDQSDPRDLRVPLRTNLNTAVGDTDSIPPRPELRVLASVGEADVSGSRAVVLEHVGYLEDTGRSVRSRLCAPPRLRLLPGATSDRSTAQSRSVWGRRSSWGCFSRPAAGRGSRTRCHSPSAART